MKHNKISHGITHLIDGTKVPKNNIIVKFLGELEELSAELGYLNVIIYKKIIKKNLDNIITKYFDILLQFQKDIYILEKVILLDDIKYNFNVNIIENYIKEISELIPKQYNFVLSGGNSIITSLFKARAKCRNAERRLVSIVYYYYNSIELNNANIDNIQISMNYINILSDYFYILARYIYHIFKIDEITI